MASSSKNPTTTTTTKTAPIDIPGAATDRSAAFKRAEAARRASGGSQGSDDEPWGDRFSAAEMSAQATRSRRGIGTDPSWIDPAGRLRQLPYGTRLPSPVPLTEEEIDRARNSGAGPLIPYPRRSPSPGSRPVFGPITYQEHLRIALAHHNTYSVFTGFPADIGVYEPPR
ncbi:uncharacterized protein CLUP02_12076 [Colletotrichum lupini]|uniref:Uncharacterized protein n=1 Tax=Colletotrichum lupini TaxID=145971 RepID=A0A9Q8WKC8_9PEZI|nr:uncharacterized protein CLUP02_12076 [Colletotrichum lupini]UQC86574.1 hypothetical protein CLUP02_12076 [Colletotrichum lupini]